MFERFTERARDVVVFAQDEARQLRHNYIGTEHLLLGLLREEEGLAARVLESLGVTLWAVRDQVARIIGEGDEITGGQIPFTPRAKKVLELALREAKSLKHNIGTEHIVLGIARENEGVAARVLLDFGVDAKMIRNEVIRMLSGPGRRQQSFFSRRLEPDPFTGQSPPLAPEVASEVDRLKREMDEAIERRDFERATMLRPRLAHLIGAANDLVRAWNEKNELT